MGPKLTHAEGVILGDGNIGNQLDATRKERSRGIYQMAAFVFVD